MMKKQKIQKRSISELNELLTKELFKPARQLKAIQKAARESAKDQKKLIARYNALISQ